ncbi:hypothetical protein C8R47DRAFT_1082741 [Mycena vitilis]|nr:hypothetical protein C8R47DRAFT_1082741 [Mycena vitilis]
MALVGIARPGTMDREPNVHPAVDVLALLWVLAPDLRNQGLNLSNLKRIVYVSHNDQLGSETTARWFGRISGGVRIICDLNSSDSDNLKMGSVLEGGIMSGRLWARGASKDIKVPHMNNGVNVEESVGGKL